MHRVTVTIDDELMGELDRVIALRGYQNRSEAIRDLARSGLQRAAEDAGTGSDCVAALVYVYDHNPRDLSRRLMQAFHDNHDLVLATTHVHLDHESCLEVAMLKGATPQVQKVADRVIAERGVRYGRVVMVPVAIEPHGHAHAHGHGHNHPDDHRHGHDHDLGHGHPHDHDHVERPGHVHIKPAK